MGTLWQRTAAVAALGTALLAGAGAARADVTVERYVKTGGFGGIGAAEGTQVEKLAGLRKRDAGTMKMTGFMGKMAGEMGSDTITDIAKDSVWVLDHKKKTYTESRIVVPLEREAPGREERKKEKPTVRVVRNEVTVKETGEKRTIAGFPCVRYLVTWVVETEDLETKERGENTMAMDLWNTPETGEIRDLQKEERAFTEAWLKKIGWDMSDAETRKLGLGALAGMLGDEESLKKGAKEVAEKLAKVKGFPLATGVKWSVKGGAGARKGGGDAPEGMPDIARGFGALKAALAKKKGGEKAAAPSGDEGGGALFESYTEIRSISTKSLPDADFSVPAGYKKVAP